LIPLGVAFLAASMQMRLLLRGHDELPSARVLSQTGVSRRGKACGSGLPRRHDKFFFVKRLVQRVVQRVLVGGDDGNELVRADVGAERAHRRDLRRPNRRFDLQLVVDEVLALLGPGTLPASPAGRRNLNLPVELAELPARLHLLEGTEGPRLGDGEGPVRGEMDEDPREILGLQPRRADVELTGK